MNLCSFLSKRRHGLSLKNVIWTNLNTLWSGETGQSGDVYVIVRLNTNHIGQTINTNTIISSQHGHRGRGSGIVSQWRYLQPAFLTVKGTRLPWYTPYSPFLRWIQIVKVSKSKRNLTWQENAALRKPWPMGVVDLSRKKISSKNKFPWWNHLYGSENPT